MRRETHGTITGTLLWYKILPLSGFNFIRAKQRLHMRRKEVCQNSWNRHTNQMSLKLTTRWNLDKHVKVYHGITALQKPHRSETNGIVERAVRRVKEGTSAVLVVSTGAIGPSVHPPDEAQAGPELVQPAGAIAAHYEHSEVCATKLLGRFFFPLSLPDRNLETSMRIHFHFHWIKNGGLILCNAILVSAKCIRPPDRRENSE